MSEQQKPLTLAECLGQPRGTEGRLFSAPSGVKEIKGPYMVVGRSGDKIDVEFYVGQGQTARAPNLLLSERAQDPVMSSEDLIESYKKYGRVAATLSTLRF